MGGRPACAGAFGAEARSARRAAAKSSACWAPRLDELGGAPLGFAGALGLALGQVLRALVHRARSVLAEVLGGLMRDPLRTVAQGAGPLAEVGQSTAERRGFVAERLLRLDPLAEQRLQPLADLPLAAGEALRGTGMGRVQVEVGIMIGIGGRLGLRFELRRHPVGEPGGQPLRGLGRLADGGAWVGLGLGQGPRGVLGLADGLGPGRLGVGDVQRPQRVGDPALVVRLRFGLVGEVALILG